MLEAMLRPTSLLLATLFFTFSAAGCGDDEATSDAATRDANTEDGGALPDASGTDANIGDGSLPDAAVDAGPMVRVLNDGFTAVYQSPDGTVVAEMRTPSAFPLAAGGTVTLLDSDPTISFFDVPEGADIRLDFGNFTPPETRQSLSINVPTPPMHAPSAFTGCSFASGDGSHTMAMDSTCLATDETGELFILAFQSGTGSYIHVDDIAVGAGGDAPLPVTLGSWLDVPTTQPTFTLDALIPGAESAQVAVYAQRGSANLYNSTGTFLANGPNFVRTFLAIVPTIGEEWTRNVLFFRAAAPRALTGAYETVGHPLPLSTGLQAADYLPMLASIDYETATGTVRWTYEAGGSLPAAVDRVRVRLTDGIRSWELWLPPSATEVALPDLPPAYDDDLPGSPTSIEVRAQDRFDITDRQAVLAGWGPEVNYESTPHIWPPHAYSVATWSE